MGSKFVLTSLDRRVVVEKLSINSSISRKVRIRTSYFLMVAQSLVNFFRSFVYREMQNTRSICFLTIKLRFKSVIFGIIQSIKVRNCSSSLIEVHRTLTGSLHVSHDSLFFEDEKTI